MATVAIFRPDDDRLSDAVDLLKSLDVEPVADPMLTIEPTDEVPRKDAEYTVFTSKTGVELAAAAEWEPPGVLCAIGDATATRLREAEYQVDVVPASYSSSGLVNRLSDDVGGARVEIARSDHGSEVLLDGLNDAGAYVHETVLYRLSRPQGSGRSTELAAAGDLDGVLFTSSLTVEYFLEAAAERGIRDAVIRGLGSAVVGCIGEPTRQTAAAYGITVDVVPDVADFDSLAKDVVRRLG